MNMTVLHFYAFSMMNKFYQNICDIEQTIIMIHESVMKLTYAIVRI